MYEVLIILNIKLIKLNSKRQSMSIGEDNKYEIISEAIGREIVEVISDQVNLSILAIISAEPTYSRKIAEVLGIRETHVSSRLKKLESLDLIKGYWRRVGKKNVKLYQMNVDSLEISFIPTGFVVRGKMKKSKMALVFPFSKVIIPKAEKFVGREEELSLLNNSQSAVVIGLPGIGKTYLVAKYAEMQGKPVFWHTFKENDGFSLVIGKISSFLLCLNKKTLFELLERKVRDYSALIEVAIKELIDVSPILVMDNFNLCRDQKVKLLIKESMNYGVKVILTSRNKLNDFSLPNVKEIVLEGIKEKDFREFFEKRGVRIDKRIYELAKKLKGHPLALEMIAVESNAEVNLDKIRAQRKFFDFIINELRKSLSTEEVRCLEALSVFSEPVPVDAIKFITKEALVNSIMRKLEEMLIVKRQGERYSLHELIAKHVHDSSDNSKLLHRRAGEYYRRKGDPFSMIEAMSHYIKGGDVEGALRLSKYTNYIVNAGLIAQIDNLIREINEDNLSDEGRARLLEMKSTLVFHNGKEEDLVNILESSINDVRKLDDKELYSRLISKLCLGYIMTNRYNKAMQVCVESAKIAEKHNPPLAPLCYAYIAEIFEEKGELESAIKYLKEGIKKVGILRSNRGNLLHEMAVVEYRRGNYDNSLELINEALNEYRRNFNYFGIAHCHWGIASVLVELGRAEEALMEYDEAIKSFDKIYRRSYSLACLAERAILKLRLSDLKGSIQDIEKVEKEISRIQDPNIMGIAKRSLGIFRSEVKGDLKGGLNFLRESEKIFRNGVKEELGNTLWAMGLIEVTRGILDEGITHLQEAESIFSFLGSIRKSEEVRRAIANAFKGEVKNLYPERPKPYL
jgi:tetratricopeptide (TPR) repeat protein/DNA-binding Lrp family transcriptional regulator